MCLLQAKRLAKEFLLLSRFTLPRSSFIFASFDALAQVLILVVDHSRCSIVGARSKIFLVATHIQWIDHRMRRLHFVKPPW